MRKSVNYYPDDLKVKVVRHYLETEDGFVKTAKKFNLSCAALVSQWVAKYRDQLGEAPVSKASKFNPKYKQEFKLEVVRHYLKSKDSLRETAKKFSLPCPLSVRNWVDKYRHLVANVDAGVVRFDGYLPTIIMNKPADTSEQALPDDPQAMSEKIRQLEASLLNEQFKNVALNTMIDVAENELQISIRKKSGAKQSRK